MAFPRGRRTPLKRRATYGRGTKRYAQTRYRRAYFNRRRGVGRKEKKGCDVTFSSESITNDVTGNTNIYLLNGIQEGVGSWNRIGRYIWNKSLELDLNLRWQSSNTAEDSVQDVASWVRCTVVWDKQPNNSVIPTFDTIFGHTNQAGVESCTTQDHLRYDNMFRFQIISDGFINPTMVNTSASNAAATAGQSIVAQTSMRYHKYMKLGNKMTNFSGTANPMTNANISTGALYLILRTPVADADGWQIDEISTARLRYVD